jgi:hypothetical protein
VPDLPPQQGKGKDPLGPFSAVCIMHISRPPDLQTPPTMLSADTWRRSASATAHGLDAAAALPEAPTAAMRAKPASPDRQRCGPVSEHSRGCSATCSRPRQPTRSAS